MDSRTDTELQHANERLIEMMAHMAHHDATPTFDLVKHIHRPLIELDASARRTAAQRPYLLMDCRFADDQWLKAAITATGRLRPDPWQSHFPRRSAVELLRHVLTLAWHTAAGAGTPPPCARLGLSPAVAELMVGLQLEDLDRIAERHVGMMRPRWERRPALWRDLLGAAQTGDIQGLRSIDLQAAQLLARDAVIRSG